MSRYLTPAKISLLALIELYVDGAVPNDAILPVLSFIASHVIEDNNTAATTGPSATPPSPSPPSSSSPSASPATETDDGRWARAESAVSILVSLADFERVLGPHAAAVGLPGRRLWDIFLQKVWGVDSLHALHEFLDRRPALLLAKSKEEEAKAQAEAQAEAEAANNNTAGEQDDAALEEQARAEAEAQKVRLAPNSPFGAFVRRAVVEFRRLRFQDACELWNQFVRYRQPTAQQYWKRRNAAATALGGRLSFDNVLVEGRHDWGDEAAPALAAVAYGGVLPGEEDPGGRVGGLPVSFDDVEMLLEFQVDQMQKFGVRIPPELRNKFGELLQNSYAVPSLSHYLRFLEAWKSGDYPTSFDYLHRYFDYTMQSRDRLFYQYALMNLAVLQAEFGCYKEALAAMLETVSTARENRDMSCLNFALSWLFHFGKAHPDLVADLESTSMLGSGKESLAYLRVKAREAGNWTLWCSALLSEAKLGLAGGESVAAALELMVRSAHILVEHNMRGMLGAQLAMHTALWDRLGVAGLAQMHCDVFRRCYARHAMFDDELKLVCRLASQLALQGRYDEAFETLDSIDRDSSGGGGGSAEGGGGLMSSWKPSQYWHAYRGLLKLRRDLHRGDLDGAAHLLAQLQQTQADDLEPDLAFVVDALRVEYLVRRADLPAAFARVDALLADARRHGRDVSIRIRLMLLKAHLLDRAGRPERGFTLVVRAASMAWRARLVPVLWQAVGALAHVLCALGEFDAARRLLVAAIPRILECGSAFASGQLYAYLADAYVGLAGAVGPLTGSAQAAAAPEVQSSSGEPTGKLHLPKRRTEYLTQAHVALDQASAHFAAVEDVEKQCEMLAKKATILKVVGDNVLANDCAAKYLVLRQQADTVTS